MTVKTLHTFTDADMQLIESALRIAREHWRTMSDVMRKAGHQDDASSLHASADQAGELAMKIETSR